MPPPPPQSTRLPRWIIPTAFCAGSLNRALEPFFTFKNGTVLSCTENLVYLDAMLKCVVSRRSAPDLAGVLCRKQHPELWEKSQFFTKVQPLLLQPLNTPTMWFVLVGRKGSSIATPFGARCLKGSKRSQLHTKIRILLRPWLAEASSLDLLMLRSGSAYLGHLVG